MMTQTAGDSLLAAWLVGQDTIARRVKSLLPIGGWNAPANIQTWQGREHAQSVPPVIPPDAPFRLPSPDEEPIVTFPQIKTATDSLAHRRVLSANDFYSQDRESRQQAFTISRVQNEETIERVRDALAEDVAEGGSLRDFQKRVLQAFDSSALSPSHVETIYRTNIGQAYKQGQIRILAHSQVATAFPYAKWAATHDARTRPTHLAMESHGIGGTAIYRTDDPVFIEAFPPIGFNCRCSAIPITLEDAAHRYGIEEAKKWLETKLPPASKAWVDPLPFDLAPGWEK